MLTAIALLIVGLTVQDVAPPTVYEVEHFHYFDELGKEHGIPLQDKVYVEGGGDKLQKELQKNPLVKDAKPHPDGSGIILTTAGKKDTIALLNVLSGKYKVFPVVMWEGIEAIPRPNVLLQVNPSVTETLIKQRLAGIGKFKLSSITRANADHYVVSFSDLELPPNILVLANLLAGDHAWVKWARPDFQPLYGKVVGKMYVTTPGDTNLGEMRQLVLVVDVYGPGKLRTDLLPALGQGGLVIVPSVEEIWLDGSPPLTSVEKGLHKTTYTIRYSFRYCRPGDHTIQGFKMIYEEGGKAYTVTLDSTGFKAPAALNDGIDDIQPITEENLLLPVMAPNTPASSFFDRPYFSWGGLAMLFCSGLILAGVVAGRTGKALKNWWLTMAHGRRREGLWRELYRLTYDLTPKKDWRKTYQKIYHQFSVVLAEFFDVTTPPTSAASWKGNPTIGSILEELENLYKKDATPDVRKLSVAIRAFYKHREYDV